MTARKILVGASMLLWIVGCGSTPSATPVDAGVSTTVDLNAPVNPDDAVLGPDSPAGEIQFPIVFLAASLNATLAVVPGRDSTANVTIVGAVELNSEVDAPSSEVLAHDFMVCASAPAWDFVRSFDLNATDSGFRFISNIRSPSVVAPTAGSAKELPAMDISLWLAKVGEGCESAPPLSRWSAQIPLVRE
jgi:hypothetical protein